jgi:hypothetical protein
MDSHVSFSPRTFPERPPGSSLMARVAFALSILAFLLPFGIAALVLGFMAMRRAAPAHSSHERAEPLAIAALWIAGLQLALLTAVLWLGWGFFIDTRDQFRHDPLVQRVLRDSDKLITLDPQSARDEEQTASQIVNQLAAINEQIRKHGEDGAYACTVYQIAHTGLDDTSYAEKRAFFDRLQRSPYLYGITGCNPVSDGITKAAYLLTAVPVSPRMPDNSAVFCTDQTGVVLTHRGGTSLDCFTAGQPANAPF